MGSHEWYGPVCGVPGWALSRPRLLALWAGCRGRCGASGVGRSPTPDCPPSGPAAGAGVGRRGSGALPTPTARPLGGLPGPVWGVRERALSHPRLPALWAGCRGRCGASGVGRSPDPDCTPSGQAAGAGVGRPGSGALPPPTARPLGRLPGPVWGVRGRTLSHPRLPALWAGCRGRCGASGVGRSLTPNCPPSGRAAGAGVGRPGSGALPPPTARSLGGLPGPVWGVRGRALSRPRLPALWAGCRGRCGASGVGRSPTSDCPPSGRAAGAGVGRPGSDALRPPTARPLGGLPGPVWGFRGRTLSHFQLPAPWAGCRGRCGASGVGRSPTPDCPPSGRAAGVGVGRLGSGALPSPTARPLGGRPGPVWGVRGRALSRPRLLALWAGCRGRCGASGVGRSPTPDCPPSGRAAGAGVGRPGSGALPPPTARPLGGLPGPVWGVRGRALSHPQLPALWAGCRGRCGASGFGRSPTPNCPLSGRAAGAGVGRPGSGALPPLTARPLGGLQGSVLGVSGRALSHPRLPALWAGGRGRCWASGVGRSPTPDCSPSGRAAGAGVGRLGSDALPPPTARPPLLSPGWSWWLLVSCLGGVLWCVPGCCAAPCCCALCRLALRCCALCCFVLLCWVLPRAVLCPGALSFVLESCAFWRRVLSCPPALCVFCCAVSLRGVVRRCALCRLRPGVSCCAFLVVSAPCGVAVWPALPRCPASLCCAPWCCAAAWCRGVLSCRPAGFVSCVGVVVPTWKTAAKFRKIFFPSFFWLLKIKKNYTRPNTLACSKTMFAAVPYVLPVVLDVLGLVLVRGVVERVGVHC